MIAFWVEIGAVGVYAATLFLIAKGPIQADEGCECRECCDTMARLEVLILDVLDDVDQHFDTIPATIRLGHEQLDISADQRDAEVKRLEEQVGR